MKLTIPLLLLIMGAQAFTQAASSELYSINADMTKTDPVSGVTSYQGNARVEVANLIIEADTISILEQNGFPARIEASGNPIEFREQTPRKNISGSAREVVFDVSELKLTLTEYSIIDSTGNNMKGKKISIVLPSPQ